MVSKIVPYLALTLPVSVYIVLQAKGIVGARYEPFVQDFSQPESGSWWLSAATQMGLFFDYLRLWLLPDVRGMSIDIRIPVSMDHLLLKALAFASFGGVAFALLFREGRSALFGYGMLYCWILFGVELSSVRFQEIFVLYRSYLWAPGYVLIGITILSLVPTKILRLTAGVAITSLLLWQAHDRLRSMSTSLNVWTDAKEKLVSESYPGAFRIYLNRSRVLSSMGRDQEALVDINHAIGLNPNSAMVYGVRGFLYLKTKKWNSALEDFNASIKYWPTPDIFKGIMYYGQASALSSLGRQGDADAALEQANQCGFKPIKIEMKGPLSRAAILGTSSRSSTQ
jgi:tetratricopeptide (TPR) repeat protein